MKIQNLPLLFIFFLSTTLVEASKTQNIKHNLTCADGGGDEIVVLSSGNTGGKTN